MPDRITPANGRVLTPQEWEAERKKQAFRRVIPARSGSNFNGLVILPKSVSFAGQNAGEQIFMLLRRHWSTNIGWIVNEAFYAVFPIILYTVLEFFNLNLIDLLGWKLFIVLVLIFYSVLLTNTIRHLSDWYFNLYLVTSERVIDYDYHPFTSSGASESTLVSIQDVKQVSIGFLPSIFDYGDVSIYTAADKNVITFHKVPNPTLVRDKILDLADVASGR